MIETNDVADRAEVGAAIMSTMRSPGWQYMLAKIESNLQSLLPKALEEDEQSKVARGEVKSIQKFLRFLGTMQKEAQANMQAEQAARDAEVADAEGNPESLLPAGKTRG